MDTAEMGVTTVKAQQIFDSRGNPTVKVDIGLSDGSFTRGGVSSGASTGRHTQLRFLLTDSEAGTIIGKRGSTINDFTNSCGARIQLSRNNEVFPGTKYRIVMVSGVFDEVIEGAGLILNMLFPEDLTKDEARTLSLIVPDDCCGGIISKAGATTKSLNEELIAQIKILPLDNRYVGLHDKLVTVTGNYATLLLAIDLILTKLCEVAHYPHNLNSSFTYAGIVLQGNPSAAAGYDIPQPANNRTQCKKIITIDNRKIGAIIGDGGSTKKLIMQRSGARIIISDRDDYIPGTYDRKVTITGTKQAVSTACSLILGKL